MFRLGFGKGERKKNVSIKIKCDYDYCENGKKQRTEDSVETAQQFPPVGSSPKVPLTVHAIIGEGHA